MKNNSIGYSILFILFLAAGSFVIYEYEFSKKDPSSYPTEMTEGEQKNFTLKVVDRKLANNTENVLSVKQGDSVTITITIDEDEEFHLHGYDKQIDLEKNTPNSLTFVANVAGRFPFELEKNKVELGALEVYP